MPLVYRDEKPITGLHSREHPGVPTCCKSVCQRGPEHPLPIAHHGSRVPANRVFVRVASARQHVAHPCICRKKSAHKQRNPGRWTDYRSFTFLYPSSLMTLLNTQMANACTSVCTMTRVPHPKPPREMTVQRE